MAIAVVLAFLAFSVENVLGESIDLDLNPNDTATLNPPPIYWNGNDDIFIIQDTNLSTDAFDSIPIDSVRVFYDYGSAGDDFSGVIQNSVQALGANRVTSDARPTTQSSKDAENSPIFDRSFEYQPSDSKDALRFVLLSLQYQHFGTPSDGFTRTIGLEINYNGNETTSTVNVTIIYVGTNENAPKVTINDSVVEYVEGRDNISLPAVTITDQDHEIFLMKMAIIEVVGDDKTYDELKLDNAPSEITVDQVNAFKLELHGDASPEVYATALSAVVYSNTAPDIGGLAFDSRTIQYTVSDGANPGLATATVQFINVNDPPLLTFGDGNTTAKAVYSEDVSQAQLGDFVSLEITDSDNLNMISALVVIDKQNVPSESLVFELPGSALNETSMYNNETESLVFKISGSASVEQYSSILSNLNIRNGAHDIVDQFDLNITITVNDGTNTSNPVVLTITFDPVNDAPLLYLSDDKLPGHQAAPQSLRQHSVTFVEDGDSVSLLPNSSSMRLEDIDSENLMSATINLTQATDGVDEVLLLDEALALNMGVTVLGVNSHIITVSGYAGLQQFKKLLLTARYLNRKEEQLSQNDRIVEFVVADAQNEVSAPFSVHVRVEERNDAPEIDIGSGPLLDRGIDKVTFIEGSEFGIHILTNPHRLQITDDDTTGNNSFHYIAGLKIVLNVTSCGKLDYDSSTNRGEFLYWVEAIPDSRINIVRLGHGSTTNEFEIVAETKGTVMSQSDAAALDDAYEKFITNVRYVSNVDEPTLFCDNGDEFKRNIFIIVTDSGSPPASAFITTTLNIQTINDHAPIFLFDVEPDGNCLGMSSRSRRVAPMFLEKTSSFEKFPSASGLTIHGFSDGGISAGSSLHVTFSNDTKMPRVLEHDQLSQLVELTPNALVQQLHLAFWETPKHLVIVYPIMGGGVKVSPEDISLKFQSDLGVCTVAGCNVYEASSPMPKFHDSADEIEPTQLYDWGLICLSFAIFGSVVAIVVYLGCTRKSRSWYKK